MLSTLNINLGECCLDGEPLEFKKLLFKKANKYNFFNV